MDDCFLWRVMVKSRKDWVCCVSSSPKPTHRFLRDFAAKQSHNHPFTGTDGLARRESDHTIKPLHATANNFYITHSNDQKLMWLADEMLFHTVTSGILEITASYRVSSCQRYHGSSFELVRRWNNGRTDSVWLFSLAGGGEISHGLGMLCSRSPKPIPPFRARFCWQTKPQSSIYWTGSRMKQ